MNRIMVWGAAGVFVLSLQASAAPTVGSNVQIGTDTDVAEIHLDWDRDTGNLFALVRNGTSGWKIYMSTDAGASWSQTAGFSGSPTTVDMAVGGDYVWVAYNATGPDARIRRASKTTGVIDGAFGYENWIDNASSSFERLVLTSNPDDGDTLFYLAVLHADDTVSFFYDSTTQGDSPVTNVQPGITDAESGLEMCWNTDESSYSPSNAFLLLSYVGTDDKVWVYRRGPGGGEGSWDAGKAVTTADSAAFATSISGYRDNFIVGVEDTGANGQDGLYEISYNGGSTWAYGSLGEATTGADYYVPMVSADSGTGVASIAQQNTAGDDTYWFRERHHYEAGTWTSDVALNDVDFNYGPQNFQADFKWMGHGWGLAYISSSGEAWFTWSRAIRYSGFETTGLGEWSSVVGD